MNYLIFSAQTDAITRNNEITEKCNFDDGVTTNYSDVIPHPTQLLWALVLHPAYTKYFTSDEMAAATQLTIDWYNTGNQI